MVTLFSVKCTSFLFCVSLSGMMKSWPVKIQEKGTPDQERVRSQLLGPVKIVKPNRPHGNSIYPTDVSVWTALKVRTRTVRISFPWRIIPGNGTGTASLSSFFVRQANVSTLPVACVLPPPPRFFFWGEEAVPVYWCITTNMLFFCSVFKGLNPLFFSRLD